MVVVFVQVIYTSFGGSPKGLHFNNLIVGLVLLTRGRDEEKAKCKSQCRLMYLFHRAAEQQLACMSDIT